MDESATNLAIQKSNRVIQESRGLSIENLKLSIEKLGLTLILNNIDDGYMSAGMQDNVTYTMPTIIAWGEGHTEDNAIRSVWESYIRFVYEGDAWDNVRYEE